MAEHTCDCCLSLSYILANIQYDLETELSPEVRNYALDILDQAGK